MGISQFLLPVLSGYLLLTSSNFLTMVRTVLSRFPASFPGLAALSA